MAKDSEVGESWPRRHPVLARVALLGVGACLALAAIAVLEIIFKFANDHEEARTEFVSDDLIEFYRPLGYRPRAGIRCRAVKHLDGALVFDAVYTIDDQHHRITPSRPNAPRTVALTGDSFVFGEGVSDEETLPWRLAETMPNAGVLNLGFSGYGPQQALAQLKGEPFEAALEGADAAVVYVFIPGHVRRAIGSMRMWLQWGRHFQCFTLESGDLVNRGSFAEARPWRSRVYDVLGRSQTLRYFNVDWPPRVDDEDLELTARILASARDVVVRRVPGASFHVLLFPDMPNNEFHPRRIAPFLNALGVEVFDLSEAVDMRAPGMIIEGDGHPTGRAYGVVATMLAAYLYIPDDARGTSPRRDTSSVRPPDDVSVFGIGAPAVVFKVGSAAVEDE